jgi:CBS domain-containing protein
MTIAAILKHKGYHVVTVPQHTTVAVVIDTLAHGRIGAVLVTDDTGHVEGIVSERDVVSALAMHGPGVLDQPAETIMTRMVRTVSPCTTEEEAMSMMTEGRFRHLPVMDGGRLIGLVSIGDVVKARIMQADHDVDSLRAYVAGAA